MKIVAATSIKSLERAVVQMLDYSSRTGPQIVNQKLMNVAGRAANKTPMANRQQIRSELGEIGRRLRVTKKGKLVRTSRRIYATARTKNAPLSALMINKRRAAKGLKGLSGREMRTEVNKMVRGKVTSAGFLKSAYFPGIKTLARTLDRPFIIARMQGIKTVGQSKGRAYPAPRKSLNPSATLINSAKEISRFGVAALEEAFQEETADTLSYVAARMQPGFDQFNKSR